MPSGRGKGNQGASGVKILCCWISHYSSGEAALQAFILPEPEETQRRATTRPPSGPRCMNLPFRLPALIVAAGVVALPACERQASPPQAAVPPPGRDSAGVTIVDDSLPQWSPTAGWSISDTPLVKVGGDAIEPAYSFAGIRGGVLLPGGGFAVGNASPPSLRIYDSVGNIAVSVSRPGRRVGEFERVGWVRAYRGDSLLLYDNLNARVLLFDRKGRYGRQLALRADDPAVLPFLAAGFADGSFLSYERRVVNPDSLPEGLYQDTLLYLRRDPDGVVVDTLGWFPGNQMFVGRPGGSLALVPLPFGRSPALVAGDQRFLVATGERYEIRSYDEQGHLRRIVRLPTRGDSVTAEAIARVRSERLADAARKGATIRRTLGALYHAMPWPSREAPLSDLMLDSGENLWAREHADPGPERWAVFDPAGRLLGRLTLPAGLTVLAIGADRILASTTDPSGREFVLVYRLKRG